MGNANYFLLPVISTIYTISHTGSVWGGQYASSECIDEFRTNGFEISKARRSNPFENARMESFFLKNTEVWGCLFMRI
jgi:hypothetical protein